MEREVKGPNCEVDEQHVRRTRLAPRAGLRDGHREGEADGRVRPRRGDLPRLDHPARPGVELRVPAARGKILSGGVDANAMQRPKRFFGSARKVEEGGSLTIIATALVDTGSRMDEVIFEEFKGTGNQEIVLDRRAGRQADLARDRHRPQRHPPRGDVDGSRRNTAESAILRRVLNEMNPPDAMELLTTRLAQDQVERRVLDEPQGLKAEAGAA